MDGLKGRSDVVGGDNAISDSEPDGAHPLGLPAVRDVLRAPMPPPDVDATPKPPIWPAIVVAPDTGCNSTVSIRPTTVEVPTDEPGAVVFDRPREGRELCVEAVGSSEVECEGLGEGRVGLEDGADGEPTFDLAVSSGIGSFGFDVGLSGRSGIGSPGSGQRTGFGSRGRA